MHFFRSDAERAMKYMLGENVDGFEMKMGWGKGVPIPLHPIYVPPALLKVTRPPEPNGLPFTCQAPEANQEGKHPKMGFRIGFKCRLSESLEEKDFFSQVNSFSWH